MAIPPDVRRRIPAGEGAWVRFRRVTADKAVITGEDGRFMLLPMAEADALAAGDPGGARRRKLGEMGFLLDSDGEAPSRLAVSDEAAIHVLRLRELGEGAASVVTDVLEAGRGRSPLGDAVPTLRGFVHLEIVDADPLGDTGVREIAEIVAAHRTEKARGGDSRSETEPRSLARRTEKARGAPYEVGAPPPEETKGLSIRLRTRLTDMTPEIAASLVKGRVAIQCLFEGPPTEAEINRILMLRSEASRAAGSAVEPFVVGVIALEQAASGPEAIVGACRAAGLSFVELQHDRGSEDLYREVLKRILDVQLSGSLLVEMGLAMHLEALVARRGAVAATALGQRSGAAAESARALSPEPRVTVWGADRRGTPEDTSGFGAGCGGCPYDPYCGRGLLRDPLSAASERRAGTSFCASSTAMFDMALSLLASPEGPRIQRAFRAWMAAHERVAKHQAGE